MRGTEVLRDADVIVTDGRIASVGARSAAITPAGATVIDVTGRFIVPGFIDIHAHWGGAGALLQPESTNGFANLAMGITTIRDPQVTPDIFDLANLVEVDGVPSPRVFSTGPGIGSSTCSRTRNRRGCVHPGQPARWSHRMIAERMEWPGVEKEEPK
jgi:imidazolonepropionase-like amidohydrolase